MSPKEKDRDDVPGRRDPRPDQDLPDTPGRPARPDQELPDPERPEPGRPTPHERDAARPHSLLEPAAPASSQHVSSSVRVEQQGTRTPVPTEEKPTPRGTKGGLKVRAYSMGYYGEVRRRIGDVFTLDDPKDFSARWMESVDARTPERVTTGNQALRQQHDEEMKARHSPGLQTGRDDVHDVPPGTATPLGSVSSVSGRDR